MCHFVICQHIVVTIYLRYHKSNIMFRTLRGLSISTLIVTSASQLILYNTSALYTYVVVVYKLTKIIFSIKRSTEKRHVLVKMMHHRLHVDKLDLRMYTCGESQVQIFIISLPSCVVLRYSFSFRKLLG